MVSVPNKTARHLDPIELSSAGMMAGLTVTLGLFATALPIFDFVFRIASALPIALISTRFRWQVSLLACVSAVCVGFAVGGFFTAVSVGQAAFIAWILGALHQHFARWWAILWASVACGGVVATGTLAFLFLFDSSRQLALDAFRVSSQGYIDTLAYVPFLGSFVSFLRWLLHWLLHYWWVFIPALTWVSVTVGMLISSSVLARVLRRLHLREVPDLFGRECDSAGDVDPLPLIASHVVHRYRDDLPVAVDDVSLRVDAGEFIVVVGENGSGKSTLARCLAGFPLTSGQVFSPGALGRGRRGGLAYLSQDADVRVVGNTVREDVAWGHEAASEEARGELFARVDEVLALVGLSGVADSSTRHLSGGELQRLALAGALLLEPRVIISDETTAMIDPAGRALMVDIFRRLSSRGVAVVHVTHDPAEAIQASRLVRMRAGRIVFDGVPSEDPWVAQGGLSSVVAAGSSVSLLAEDSGGASSRSDVSLWVRHAGVVVRRRTPWERSILENVSVIVAPGESLLITGGNGSGKTTLARLMAGLVAPTSGEVTLGLHPMVAAVGSVSLSHQFARLQLLRPSVGEDILDAVGGRVSVGKRECDDRGFPVFSDSEWEVISSALGVVGLDKDLATRGIDELSGGQQRRVALAGLIASDPQVLILDEPFAGLDVAARQQLVEVLWRLRHAGTSLVLISHDDDGLVALADRHIHLSSGRIVGADEESPTCRARRGVFSPSTSLSFPEPLPGDSLLKGTWAGTKIACWAVVCTLLLLVPSWPSVAVVGAYLCGLSVVGRVPFSACPRVPFVVLAGFLGGIFGAWMGGDLLVFVRALLVLVVTLWGTLLLLWTTHTWQFTDALAIFLRPLTLLRLPVWVMVHAMSLTVKSVPVFLDQARTLQDTMTIRLYRGDNLSLGHILSRGVDVTTAALSAAAHRGVLVGQAMLMRGGIPVVSWPQLRVSWRDGVVVAWTLCACVGVGVVHFFW